jgi:hypothetical protein
VSGGVRLEHYGGTDDVDRNSTLPMFGAAFVQDLGGAALKFRVAYGKGIRPPETTIRTTSWMGMRGSADASNLSSEEQLGVEAGVDLLVGRTHGLTVSNAYSIADSRVRRLAIGYTGDLRPGDRMLRAPERTVNVTGGYARGPWSASVTGSRAFDWVN